MKKIEKEKKIVELMIRIYCRRKEGNKELCEDCRALLEYAQRRLDSCKFGEGKPSCKRCPVHCYRPDMRERIRAVMRFSGPRLLFIYPIESLKHL